MHSHYIEYNRLPDDFIRLNPCCNGRCTRTVQLHLYKMMWEGLNPCCNGRCTRTSSCAAMKCALLKCLNPCCNGRCTRTPRNWLGYRTSKRKVLILVVMEDALALTPEELEQQAVKGLNPCCNGRCTRTAKLGLCFV